MFLPMNSGNRHAHDCTKRDHGTHTHCCRQSEQEKLLEEDEDLGDFSAVQRETEILRSVSEH